MRSWSPQISKVGTSMRCRHLPRFGSGPRGSQVIVGDGFRLRPQRAGDDVVGFFLIVEEIAQPLLVAAQERIELLDAGDMETGGAAERQRGQALRAAHGQLRGAATAA